MKAIAYARFSSDNQREESIDAQLRAIREYADNKGVIVIKEYIDEARSATTDNRPLFLQMFEDISSGRIEADFCYVHKLDRFARNRYDSAIYKRKLTNHNMCLVAVAQPLDDSPESIILESMLEAMNEYYSKNLAREVMKGMRENAYKGLHTGGKPPLGYDVGPDKKLIINQSEADAVRIIFDMYLSGESYPKIIIHLTQAGYTTKTGKQFQKTSVYEILRNEKYTGIYIFNKAVSAKNGKRNNHAKKDAEQIIKADGVIPAIITSEQFEAAQKIMEKRKQAPAAAKAKEVYLLTGLIYCGKCNGVMVGNRAKQGRNKQIYAYYECNNKKRLKTCDAKTVNKEYIESFVVKWLLKAIFSDEGITQLVKMLKEKNNEIVQQRQAEIKYARNELRVVEDKIQNIIKAISDGMYNPSMKDALSELEQQKEILSNTIHSSIKKVENQLTESMIQKYLEKDKNSFLLNNIQACKNIISSYVKKVTILDGFIDSEFGLDLDGGGGACLTLETSGRRPTLPAKVNPDNRRNAKLTEEQVQYIREHRSDSLTSLCKKYNVSKAQICRIWNGERWKKLK
jgi:site-specific DNA recombinase